MYAYNRINEVIGYYAKSGVFFRLTAFTDLTLQLKHYPRPQVQMYADELTERSQIVYKQLA